MKRCLFFLSLHTFLLGNEITWQPPTNISTPPPPAQTYNQQALAVHTDGFAMAVYRNNFSTTERRLQAVLRPVNGSWSNPINLTSPGDNTQNPSIAMDGQGNALIAYEDRVGTDTIKVITYNRATNQFTPFGFTISSTLGTQTPRDPQVAMNAQGNAVVVWRNEGTNTIQTNRRVGGIWDNPTTISTVGTVIEPHVGIDQNNNAIAVWENDTTAAIEANRLVNGAWGTPETVEGPGVNTFTPDIAVNPSGLAILIWRRNGPRSIRTALTTIPDIGTYTLQTISDTGGGRVNPTVAIAPNGYAVAVWDGDATTGIEANVKLANSVTFGTPLAILSNASTAMPRVALDGQRNATAIWDNNDTGTIQVSSLPLGQTWSAATNLSGTGTHLMPRIGLDSFGNGVAIWDSTSNETIRASIGLIFPVTPPNFRGETFQIKFLNVTQNGRLLLWDPSPTSGVTYRLFRNGLLLTTTQSLRYRDNACTLKSNDLYTLIAITPIGLESPPATLQF